MIEQDSSDPTGVKGDSRADSALVRARHRKQNAALQMRLARVEWSEIAEVIGYPTARQAKVAVEQALERELNADEDSKEKMRNLAGQQYNRMIRAVWAKAMDPNNPEQLAAQRELRATVQAHTKLYGLDAPTEVTLHTPTREEIEAWVENTASTRTLTLEEDNIFDAEWEEDGPDALPAS